VKSFTWRHPTNRNYTNNTLLEVNLPIIVVLPLKRQLGKFPEQIKIISYKNIYNCENIIHTSRMPCLIDFYCMYKTVNKTSEEEKNQK